MLKDKLSKKEYRRKYMSDMVFYLRHRFELNREEAKKIAAIMCLTMEDKFVNGEVIDLGFVKIFPKTHRPRMFKSNMDGRKYFMGESKRWKVHFRGKWLNESSPSWSIS